ncbi:translation initiation factor IF-2 [Candidatus Kaiserbacteria bacterium RIFCSPHIGHO2_02_FULL_49_16]|uniref:Translation initiation factor IF-2 n=1 Tax=Candidatus Kaiserbacteria bacterium RIFCSPHIGHO2_02_FULL_49_16 TaxID=1798490 RepID=A0A1F6DF34_9BACT|nr:MAG: translation initiation factor IF-2 [Candidatus Kaiserbacteria bacterium RIFCSPHIGHO2_02_FULL_49_16]
MAQETSNVTERPPIVAVMGHVDHGKSTLLDFIRKTNVAGSEAGGITQHVAAYEVVHSAKRITFIDTPGHAAFKAIRARGANVADIAILVVAADDGVKAQTLEALESIRAAKTPFIVAINKIDKPSASVERTQASLMENAVYLETLGGDVPWTAISAKSGTGVDELLDLILAVAEMEGLKGDATLPAEGWIIEAHRDPKRGIAATLIITNGSLSTGMSVRAGRAIAPVRIMENSMGKTIKQAGLASPISITGFDELPIAGEPFQAYKSRRDAENARSADQATDKLIVRPSTNASSEESDGVFRIPIVVRADTTGSLEAIEHEMRRIGDEHSQIKIVLSGIGDISENDIKAASSSFGKETVIIGFNVNVDAIGLERARQHGIRIEKFDIIYKLVEKLEEILKESSPKRSVEEITGSARVIRQFSTQKNLHVVGGSVTEGYIERNGFVRVTRRGTVIGIGKIKNIQSHKENVNRVEMGGEFGAQIEAVFEITQGDTLQGFTTVLK